LTQGRVRARNVKGDQTRKGVSDQDWEKLVCVRRGGDSVLTTTL